MESGTKKWIIGCGGCLTLVVIVGVVVVFWTRQKVLDIQEGFTNPEKKVLALLNAETLPPGYHPQMALSIPVIMDMLIISDEEKVEETNPNMGSDGLIYMKFKGGDQDLVDFMDGTNDDPEALRKSNINLDTDALITRGRFTLDDQQILYIVQRGSIQLEQGRTRGISTIFLVQCGEEKKMRLGIRYGPDPALDTAVEDLDLSGSVGDIEALKSFLGYFQFCQ